jgi:hypothetical protein
MWNSKHAFWQALVFSVAVFVLGLILGFFLESSRAEKVQYNLLDSEINILDNQVRDRIVGDFNVDCDLAVRSIFDFADKIYDEAVKLEAFDGAAKFSKDEFLILHRRYDLLRTLLWTESVALKDKCGGDFHTVIYLYDYANENIDVKSQQQFYSRLLLDLKNRNGEEIILIPIATDTNLASVDLLVENYDIAELPVIIIDEREVITGIIKLDELESIVFEEQGK